MSAQPGAGLSSGVLAGWVEQLAGIDVRVGDVERIDRIRELGRVKSACAAAQAELTVAFVASQTVGLCTKRATDERARRSVSAQVALARRESPFRGGRHVGLAQVLTAEMPNVLAALRAGVINEWRATLIVRETACLQVDDRRQVDLELAGKLGGLSDKKTAQAAARIGQRLDPGVYVARARKAVGDRRARRLVREASPKIKSWIRRLYTDPGTGQLIDADSRRRTFSPAARRYLVARDQTCRGPFCDAPIRHADHVVSHDNGGPTRTVNGQGLCERCNYTKQEPGWHSEVDEHGITITTPTGHTARSVPPLPPRSTPWAEDRPIEYWPLDPRKQKLTAKTPVERKLLRLIRTG